MPYFLAPLWNEEVDYMDDERLFEHFEKCLRCHDWTYDFSDDDGVFRAGEYQSKHIKHVAGMLERVDKEKASKLFFSYCPWFNDDGSRIEKF